MQSTKKGIVLLSWMAMAGWPGVASAEPSYLVYPKSPAVFRYDPARYEVVTPDDPKFQGSLAIGGQMLWDRVDDRIPHEVYRAPALIAFEPSVSGNEFLTYANDLEIVVDGFAQSPRTLGSLCLRFSPEPYHLTLQMHMDGYTIDRLTASLENVEVVTPLGNGYYSDTGVHHIVWAGAPGMRVVAFSDKDGDGVFDGVPAWSVVARDATVPVEQTTWGAIKALYRE